MNLFNVNKLIFQRESSNKSPEVQKRVVHRHMVGLEEALLKRYNHQMPCGNKVRGVEIHMAVLMNATDFKASAGWLFCFRQ